MPKRTIKHVYFSYVEPVDTPLGPVNVIQTAYQGQTLDLSEEDAARGDRLGSFEGTEPDVEPVPFVDGNSGQERAARAAAGTGDPQSFVDNATAKEVLDHAGDNPDTAEQLLSAEEGREGGPRATVVAGLERVIEKG